jgi:hypothetical protein
MLDFQNVMNRFLETQRSVMSSYLRGSAGQVASDVEMRAPEAPVAASSPAPESLEAAVEIRETPAPPAVEAVAPSVPAGRDKLEAQLLEIVSERTGYPPDMLGLDVDIEAELGIDSIKGSRSWARFSAPVFPKAPSRGRHGAAERNQELRGSSTGWKEPPELERRFGTTSPAASGAGTGGRQRPESHH